MNITSLSSSWNVAGGVDTMSGASSYVGASDSDVTQARSTVQQQSQNFKALTTAIQSGDLTSAQSAYSTVQQQIQSATQSAGGKSLFDSNSTIGKDFQAIGNALQSALFQVRKLRYPASSRPSKLPGITIIRMARQVMLPAAASIPAPPAPFLIHPVPMLARRH